MQELVNIKKTCMLIIIQIVLLHIIITVRLSLDVKSFKDRIKHAISDNRQSSNYYCQANTYDRGELLQFGFITIAVDFVNKWTP